MSGDEGEAAATPARKDPSDGKPSHEEALKKAEPFIRLARLGAERWNRWIRTIVDEKEAKALGLEGVEKLSEEELGQLAKDAGIEGLPVIGRVKGEWQGPDFASVDFRKIEQPSEFRGFAFPIATTFIDTRFGAAAHFIDVRFGSGVRFDRARFVGGARFDRACFGLGACFEGASLGFQARFVGANFDDGVRFDRAEFGAEVSFEGTCFGNGASFEGTRFEAGTVFDSAIFGDGARFLGASFDDVSTRIGDRVRFAGTSFGDDARFEGARFGDGARFDGARFLGKAYFGAYEAQGSRDTQWKVSSRIRFDDELKQTLIDEHVKEAAGDTFSGIYFTGAYFEDVADFSGRRFKGPVSFCNVTFAQVPELANVEGAGRIDPSGMTISFTGRVHIPIIDRELRVRHWTTKGWIPARIRRLRKIMADIHAHDIERDLFILEKKADRGVLWALGGWRNRLRSLAWILLLGIYGALSDCGRSLVRPVAWGAAAWAGFRWLYPVLGVGETVGPLTTGQAALLERDLSSFTTGNMLPFVSGLSPARTELLKRLFGEGIEIPGAVEWAAIAQNATGALLLFLLLLAIRNRFRVG